MQLDHPAGAGSQCRWGSISVTPACFGLSGDEPYEGCQLLRKAGTNVHARHRPVKPFDKGETI